MKYPLIGKCFRRDYCRSIWECPLREEIEKRMSAVLGQSSNTSSENPDVAVSVYNGQERDKEASHLFAAREGVLDLKGCYIFPSVNGSQPELERALKALHEYWCEHHELPDSPILRKLGPEGA
jgi:hypothetical protein